MKRMVFFLMFVLVCTFMSQAQNGIKSYILQIEGDKAYLDVYAPLVKVGDVLSVYEDGGVMIHPVTQKKIKKEGRIIADLEILEIQDEYSVASIYPAEAVSRLKVGMMASMSGLNAMPEPVMEQEMNPVPSYSFPVMEEVTLPAGSIIPIEASQSVRASKVDKGDRVNFRVSRNVVRNGVVIIPAGTIVVGKVYEAKRSKWYGTRGRLGIRINEIQLPSGETLPLRNGDIYIKGKNRTVWAILICAFICGSKAEMPYGYSIDVTTAYDITLPISN